MRARVNAGPAQAGAYSGAIMNPAAVVALHLYDKDMSNLSVWRARCPPPPLCAFQGVFLRFCAHFCAVEGCGRRRRRVRRALRLRTRRRRWRPTLRGPWRARWCWAC